MIIIGCMRLYPVIISTKSFYSCASCIRVLGRRSAPRRLRNLPQLTHSVRGHHLAHAQHNHDGKKLQAISRMIAFLNARSALVKLSCLSPLSFPVRGKNVHYTMGLRTELALLPTLLLMTLSLIYVCERDERGEGLIERQLLFHIHRSIFELLRLLASLELDDQNKLL